MPPASEGAMPPDLGAMPPAPEGAMPPAPEGAMPPIPPDQQQVVSDARLKLLKTRMRSVVSDQNLKQPVGWKPPKSILAGIRGETI
jgi:hypothetical protein